MGRESKMTAVVLIQGSSCTGKTAFGDYLTGNLEITRNVKRICLDDYYRGVEFNYRDTVADSYDFDNPAALDWAGLATALHGYADGDEFVVEKRYDFTTHRERSERVRNSRPEIIILEGIYAFNLFNGSVFDTSRLSAWNPPERNPDAFVENAHAFRELFDVIKIEMTLEKEMVKAVRMRRDAGSRYRDSSAEFARSLETRFETLIWPATQKWVYTEHNEPDIRVVGGTFNLAECRAVAERLFVQFGVVEEIQLGFEHEFEFEKKEKKEKKERLVGRE